MRKPTEAERRLLARLAHADNLTTEWLDGLTVAEMDDGGMGSLRLAPEGKDDPDRAFGRAGEQLEFADADGIPVIASLYLDDAGAPLELEMWKVDFTPLVRIPDFD